MLITTLLPLLIHLAQVAEIREHGADLRQLIAEVSLLPQVRADSVEQLVQFSIEQDMLAARTLLQVAEGPNRVVIPELRGVVRLTVYGPQNDPDTCGRNFQVLQQDLTGPAGADVHTMISAVAGRVILSRDAESRNARSSVQLIQDPPPAPGDADPGDPVRLLVTGEDGASDVRRIDIRVSAGSFSELLRRHPRQVDEHLRPIFRDYAQEHVVFAVDSRVAWQVLGADFTIDAATIAKVRGLVLRLDSESFQDREAAMEELQKLGHTAALAIAHIDRSKLSLQQNSGIDSFMAGFAPLPQSEVRMLADRVGFLLDCLYCDEATLRQLALNRLRQLAGRDIAFDNAATPEARNQAVRTLRDALMPTTQPGAIGP